MDAGDERYRAAMRLGGWRWLEEREDGGSGLILGEMKGRLKAFHSTKSLPYISTVHT